MLPISLGLSDIRTFDIDACGQIYISSDI